MKFSFQTVWIIFGVTLVHLFVISALSPEGGARRDAVSKADPVASPETRIERTLAVNESAAEDSAHIIAEEKSAPPRDPQSNAGAQVGDLVETGVHQEPSVAVDQPALSSPPQVIREIRDLKPVRRS